MARVIFCFRLLEDTDVGIWDVDLHVLEPLTRGRCERQRVAVTALRRLVGAIVAHSQTRMLLLV